MIAILGDIGTAALWATTVLGSARASRVIGAWSTLAWVMLVGLVVAIPFLFVGGGDVRLTEAAATSASPSATCCTAAWPASPTPAASSSSTRRCVEARWPSSD